MTANIVVTYDDWHGSPDLPDGGFWTTRLFWDCECTEDYIHDKDVLSICPECRVRLQDGYPDSRVTEVLKAGLAIDQFVPLSDALEKIYELAQQNVLSPECAGVEEALLNEAFVQQRSLDVVHDFILNNFGEGEAIFPHFTLENKEYRIDAVASFKDRFDFTQVEWHITDGLGNLARVAVALGVSGGVILHGEEIILNEDTGDIVGAEGGERNLFDAGRKIGA